MFLTTLQVVFVMFGYGLFHAKEKIEGGWWGRRCTAFRRRSWRLFSHKEIPPFCDLLYQVGFWMFCTDGMVFFFPLSLPRNCSSSRLFSRATQNLMKSGGTSWCGTLLLAVSIYHAFSIKAEGNVGILWGEM